MNTLRSLSPRAGGYHPLPTGEERSSEQREWPKRRASWCCSRCPCSSQRRFREDSPHLNWTRPQQLAVVRRPQRSPVSPEPALPRWSRTRLQLCSLPKPALPSRDPPAVNSLLGSVVQAPPLQRAAFTVSILSRKNRLKPRPCTTLSYSPTPCHSHQVSIVLVSATPENMGLQVPQCHAQGTTSFSFCSMRLLLPTCSSGGGPVVYPVRGKMVR